MSNLLPDQEAALNLIKEGAEYQNIFFNRARDPRMFWRLSDDGYFSPGNNPIPSTNQDVITVNEWPALIYLERISSDKSDSEYQNYSKAIMEILREATHASPPVDNPRTWWRFSKIISNLPTDILSCADIELTATWLANKFGGMMIGTELSKGLMKNLLESTDQRDHEKALKLGEIVTRLHKKANSADRGGMDYTTLLKERDLAHFFKELGMFFGKQCSQPAVSLIQERLLASISSEKDDPLSCVWRPAIEDNPQNHENDTPRTILITILRDVLLGFSKKGQAGSLLQTYLDGNSFLLRRVAIHILNECYKQYDTVFWRALRPDWFTFEVRHELFELIRKHFREFSQDQQQHLISMIEQLREETPAAQKNPIYHVQRRLIWLEAIEGQGNQRADELYRSHLEEIGSRPYHPEFPAYTESFSGSVAPLTSDQILGMTIGNIVKYLDRFSESEGLRAPSEDGLAESLCDAVTGNPAYFANELQQFSSCKLRYQWAILRGLSEAWKQKKSFDWDTPLTFCWNLVNEKDFLVNHDSDSQRGMTPSKDWLITAICDLIIAGTQHDNWAMPDLNMDKAATLISHLLELQPSTMADEEDLMFQALNTPKGRILQAFFNHTLRRLRICDQQKGNKDTLWQEVAPIFERELKKAHGSNLEFSAFAGTYLPSLYYLNKTWVINNIDNIFSTKHQVNWRCAMEGYLHVSRFYNELYKLLKSKGHLRRALSIPPSKRELRRKLVQLIGVAYILGNETMDEDGALIKYIVNKGPIVDLTELSYFFWGERKELLNDSVNAEKRRQAILTF